MKGDEVKQISSAAIRGGTNSSAAQRSRGVGVGEV
jgi:hypothetical protein